MTVVIRCEVKKEYDLRGMKWKSVAERPTTFTTANDKTIVVDKTVSLHNDRVMKQGEVNFCTKLVPASF